MALKVYPINDAWNFTIANQTKVINLPHNINNIPLNYFKANDIHKAAFYEKTLEVPASFSEDKLLKLVFYGVASIATVFCNDIQIFKNYSPYTEFTVDLTTFANKNKTLKIKVNVENFEDKNIPPFGGKMDYLTFGGIYRKVSLFLLNKDYLEKPKIETNVNGNCLFSCLNNKTKSQKINITISELNTDKNTQTFALSGLGKLKFNYKNPIPWTLENPILYKAIIETDFDKVEITIGFRSCEFKKDGFYLNNKKIKLQGLNRHQCYPWIGYAMPENFQKNDAIILKNMGINLVRTSHYPQDPAFLDACDEIGLLVFEEIPGWQYLSKNKTWLDRVQENVKLMIERDFHHPSIIIWGVRINESFDNHELYTNTNKITHEIDATRQTGGVRYLTHSELLEDVYTFNDFIYKGNNEGLRIPKKVTKNKNTPYLVTEYCGHMFPTKRFDNEKRRMEFALRHATILNAMYSNKRITGAIGWCFFDYQTHDNFGNGDMLCYHGVADIFRVPKFAFYIYKAQTIESPFVVSGTYFDAGEFSQFYQTKYVFATNTDSIKLYRDEEFIGQFYPDKDNFPALKHPPIIINNLFQNRLKEKGFNKRERNLLTKVIETGRLNSDPTAANKYALKVGLLMLKHKIKLPDLVKLCTEISDFAILEKPTWKIEGINNDKVVCTQTLDKNENLKLTSSTTQKEFKLSDYPSYQVAQVTLKAGYTNTELPASYCFDALTLETEGTIELYGTPNLISLKGGIAGIFIRTKGEKGEGILNIKSPRFYAITIKFKVN